MLNLLIYSYMVVLNSVLLLSSERVTKKKMPVATLYFQVSISFSATPAWSYILAVVFQIWFYEVSNQELIRLMFLYSWGWHFGARKVMEKRDMTTNVGPFALSCLVA